MSTFPLKALLKALANTVNKPPFQYAQQQYLHNLQKSLLPPEHLKPNSQSDTPNHNRVWTLYPPEGTAQSKQMGREEDTVCTRPRGTPMGHSTPKRTPTPMPSRARASRACAHPRIAPYPLESIGLAEAHFALNLPMPSTLAHFAIHPKHPSSPTRALHHRTLHHPCNSMSINPFPPLPFVRLGCLPAACLCRSCPCHSDSGEFVNERSRWVFFVFRRCSAHAKTPRAAESY